MANPVNILALIFDQKICHKEIKMFRGAVLSLFDGDAAIICHNHKGEKKYRYSYPLVQYKEMAGTAAIVLINEATLLLQDFYNKFPATINLGEKTLTFKLMNILPLTAYFDFMGVNFKYSLSRWLPFNAENYKVYSELESLSERISMLEKIIIGNILSMAKGLGVTIEGRIVVSLSSINRQYRLYNKNIPLAAFDVEFNCNIDLPDYIGLGKNSSIGYGIIHKIK